MSFARRRAVLGALLCTPVVAPFAGEAAPATFARAIADLEQRAGGRLGVAVLDTADGRVASHRGDERFALCSTFKALAAGFVLARVDRGSETLDRRIAYAKSDLVDWSPVTEGHDAMTVAALCDAAVTRSDNTAANLMLRDFGGPSALTTWLRSIGDPVTRLDRNEPSLNEAKPGDPRDTTSPIALVRTLRTLVLGDALSPASRAQLAAWLVDCRTGDARLRAGLPATWKVGDKTGTGGRHATNDVAVLWPPDRAPLVVAAYFVGSPASPDARNAVLADVGRVVAASTGIPPT